MKQLIFLFGLVFFISCGGKEKEARIVLEEARALYLAQSYSGAKQLLDSLKAQYPGEYQVQRERQALVVEIEMTEQKRNLEFCDSLLSVRIPEVDLLKKEFVYEKDSLYEETGRYIYKLQRIERNVQRSYLRSGVNENGEMYIASVYYGAKPIRHTALKVSIKSGEYALTETVPADGSNNYSFTDEGMTSEIVTYNKGKDNGVIAFISNHQGDERLKLTYTGGREYVTTLFPADQKAVAECYLLSTGLLEIEKLKKEISIATAKIEYLNSKQ